MRLLRRWEDLERLPVHTDRFQRILDLVAGKEVLDCGCVGWEGEREEQAREGGHGRIAARAKYCLGVDLSRDGVERRKSYGHNMVVADVERMSLGRQFDVIVAADLIEHLANPGLFLERAAEHLRDDGLLCIATPNANSLNTAAKAFFGVRLQINEEHTCWYDRITLRQLISRYGFQVREEYWVDYGKNPLVQLAVRVRPNLAHHFVTIAQKGRRHEAG